MKSGQEVELFTVATCGASPHPQRLAALNDLKTGITSLLEELEVTKRISEKRKTGKRLEIMKLNKEFKNENAVL